MSEPVLPGDLRYPPMHDQQTEAERRAEWSREGLDYDAGA